MSDGTVLAAGNFLIPDATFLAEIFAFLLILAALWKFVIPPIQKSMEARQEAIRAQIDESREARERLEAAEAEYKNALAEARAEAARMREEAAKTKREIIEAAKEEARVEAEGVTRRAEERLEIERRQVLVQLRQEVGRMSAELASRIVGESLADTALQTRIIDRFLAELDEADTGAKAQPEQVR
ncbi:MAG: F-type H+-transporting ATPase subunit b [Frankiaceae bacterium]|jgi:F-type H+-transporting ATPase subunit b|nr:F-type H+-transporting ATPase subunit b [Frankiaceae bacterium]MDX6226259.1 F-type H+-transporting ATPase subunit b [Frankiales bacterium]MDX6274655.1 F-type H+-transporting ATPase subunit b [Frankiales bacterium]